jgi:DNA-binding IclR family transcriptional regulator
VPAWKEFEAQLQEVRRHGLSRSEGEIIPGVNAMSAPVFDHTGAIALALTAIGPAGILDSRWDGPLALALRRCADEVSQRLGAVRPAS